MKQFVYRYTRAVTRGAVAFLFLSLGLLSCGDKGSHQPDIPEEPEMCRVFITLQTPKEMHPATKTGSDTNPGISWQDDEVYERIMREWVVVVYDDGGSYAGHVMQGTTTDKGDYETNVELELPKGTYTFFAFANWSSLEQLTLPTAEAGQQVIQVSTPDALTSFLKGASPAQLEQVVAHVGDFKAKYNVALKDRRPIPMSSYGHKENIFKAENNEVKLPLIRMIGKVEVTFNNGLKENVSITEVKIGNFQRQRPIFWSPWKVDAIPYYLEFDEKWINSQDWQSHYQHKAPSFPDGKVNGVAADLTYSIVDNTSHPNGFSVPQQTVGTELPQVSNYVNESMLPSETYTSNMTITVARQGTGAKSVSTTTPTDFAFVRRNDLLKIPILFSNFTAKLRFHDLRLPIGVYPTTIEFDKEKTGIQVLTPVTYHLRSAGKVKIEYILEQIVAGDWSIRYKPETGVVDGKKYSSVQLISNSNDLLIDSETHKALVDGEYLFMKHDTTNPKGKGYFTICTQELTKQATATLLLTLIVEYGDTNQKRDIEIPYTIQITNVPESVASSGTTTKGGDVR